MNDFPPTPTALSEMLCALPRLLYVGDVPVEAASHGSTLIYRLLQKYPIEKLHVIEGNLRTSAITRRLENVDYCSIKVGWLRPLHTRYSRWARLAYSYAAHWSAPSIKKSLRGFEPEAILTVTHDYLWLGAAQYARKYALPLHVICHDDWPEMDLLPPTFRDWIRRKFEQVYQQATSCLCISPYMVEEYKRRYGVEGTVVYPSRARDSARFDFPPARLRRRPEKLTVVYAGNVTTHGYWRALRYAAQVLAQLGGRFILYTPHTSEQVQAHGLITDNVECRGLVSSALLIESLRHEADVLFIPMSFDEVDRPNMKISFPSKLTDSTVPGVPIIIYGPDYCSAVRWARENEGVAEVVNNEDPMSLKNAFVRLMDPECRWRFAVTALHKGEEYFSYEAAEHTLYSQLTGYVVAKNFGLPNNNDN